MEAMAFSYWASLRNSSYRKGIRTMSTNGQHANGSGEWSTLTLPDSGATLEYRHVSHMLLNDVQRSLKPPRPPMIEMDYGGNKKWEANPSHPDHLEALREYNNDKSERVLGMAIVLGVRVEIDRERVKELREKASEMEVVLPESDLVLYVTRVLCETGADLIALRDAVIRKAQPTEGAVAESVERFPSDVPQS